MKAGFFTLVLFWNDEVEGKVKQDRRENPGNDRKHNIAETEYPRAYFHPFSETAKDTADHRSAMLFFVMSIDFSHVVHCTAQYSEKQTP